METLAPWLEGILHWIHPRLCWACGRLLVEPEDFCWDCLEKILHDPFPSCPRCSSSVGPHVNLENGCTQCRDTVLHFQGAFRLGPYEGLLRELILRMKWQKEEGLAEVLGRLAAQTLGRRLEPHSIDLVLPVPLHWTRWLKRGYNQSEVLARAIAGELKLPCHTRWVRRLRPTIRQSQFTTRADRLANVHQAFRTRSHLPIQGKTILLVDDILTTGSTASEVARVLKPFKPARILVAVLGHGH